MKKYLPFILLLSLFACNHNKDDTGNPEPPAQSVPAPALVSTSPSKNYKDSLKHAKLAYWKKQATLMSVNLDADRAMLNNAQQFHFGRLPRRKKKKIEEATTLLQKDKIRAKQIQDSLRKYQN